MPLISFKYVVEDIITDGDCFDRDGAEVYVIMSAWLGFAESQVQV